MLVTYLTPQKSLGWQGGQDSRNVLWASMEVLSGYSVKSVEEVLVRPFDHSICRLMNKPVDGTRQL